MYVRYLSTTNLSLAIPAGTSATFNTVTVADGSATTPSITNDGDTNTGIFFPVADTIAFAEGGVESVRIDASGNLGIGTSSPSAKLDVSGQGKLNAITFSFNTSYYNTDNSISNYSAGNYMYVSGNSTGGTGGLYLQGAGNQKQAIIVDGISTGGNIAFQTNGTERARIDSSGNLLVGTTNTGLTNANAFAFQPASAGSAYANHVNGSSSGNGYIFFGYNGGSIGSITQNGTTAVAYNTTSDYRLKENIAPLTGALTRVAALKPCTYTWKFAPDEIGEGFIAHELAEVVPQCVTGEKDAVDADGNPQYQGIDTSFLVATLTAAIQEQQALITALTTRITALENNNATQ